MQVDDMFDMVKRAVETNHPAHGYLLIGPVRGAAMSFAIRVLQLLFCRAEIKPCGHCEGCRLVAERKNPDIQWVFPEKRSRVISVQQVRETLIHEISQTTLAGGWKAGVVVGADRMNEASANTFLKTLEEPPDNTLFLLLSDQPQHLLPTIVSRCQRVDLSAARVLDEPWRTRVVTCLASPLWGSPLRNVALASELAGLLSELKEEADRLIRLEEVNQQEEGMEATKERVEAKVEARYREMRADVLLTLVRWYRDLLVLCAGGDAACVFNRDQIAILRERAQHIPLHRALHNVTVCEEIARQLERSIPDESVLACALDRMTHGVVTLA